MSNVPFRRDFFMPMTHDRYIVIGATGSGKSTLAQRLSQKLGLEYIELDALFWRLTFRTFRRNWRSPRIGI
jgi:cytidylate kinase